MNIVTTPKGIADLVRATAYEDRAADFSEVVEVIEAINNERAREALRGAAHLAAPDAKKQRRFVLAYLHDGGIHTAYGIEHVARKRKSDDGKDETPTSHVSIDDYEAPFYGRYSSIDSFCESLKNRKILHYIQFVD